MIEFSVEIPIAKSQSPNNNQYPNSNNRSFLSSWAFEFIITFILIPIIQ